METQEQASAVEGRRVIKRYSNRKLYDTRDSRYVTLNQIGEMVRRGEDVQIIDNKTKEDKTEVTLALILSEDLKNKPQSVPLGMLRHLIQERGERILTKFREGPIGRLIPKGDGDAEGSEAGAVEAGSAAANGGPAEGSVEEQDDEKRKGRLNELMATSRRNLDQLQAQIQASLDERVAAIVPGVALIRQLRSDIETLRARVESLEGQLAARPDGDKK